MVGLLCRPCKMKTVTSAPLTSNSQSQTAPLINLFIYLLKTFHIYICQWSGAVPCRRQDGDWGERDQLVRRPEAEDCPRNSITQQCYCVERIFFRGSRNMQQHMQNVGVGGFFILVADLCLLFFQQGQSIKKQTCIYLVKIRNNPYKLPWALLIH